MCMCFFVHHLPFRNDNINDRIKKRNLKRAQATGSNGQHKQITYSVQKKELKDSRTSFTKARNNNEKYDK